MNQAATGDRVLVVGAGIVGIACAHYLTKIGLRVTVVDRNVVAGECSHANCGYVCPSHVLPLTEPAALRVAVKSLFNPRSPFRVKPQWSVSLTNWMWQFARRCNNQQMLTAGRHLKAILDSSMSEYRQLIADEDFDCDWRNDGLLYVLLTAHGFDEFAKGDDFIAEHFGLRARRIAGDDLQALDPALKPGLAGAFHYTGDSSVRPDRLARVWTERLSDQGVEFVEQCELKSIVRESGRIKTLVTSKGDMAADHYVVAAGAWSAHMARELQCQIPIQPGKGYSITMDRPDPCPAYPMLFPEHRVGMTPFRDGYRLGSMMEFVGFDTTIPAYRIEQLRASAEPYLISPHTETVHETWYGWRPMTWDSLPIIGQVPALANAWLATGHNMLGLSLATGTGRLLGELMTGTPPHIDAAAYSPSRFARSSRVGVAATN